ncbi:hypothetical protein POL68_33775 [Stigmatella sp. ncwal1]|uniref:Uncharacterized protein n=1 Tax=Stigmatella ashevillensis TaxID=2995309 RepID=A0ABT5DIM6_9BACT|nr:hypothetical protein [Stigmatella ashevillena]MDC0713483.1 hypothetical protein [Stigmatella ashevillena]
MRWRSGVVGGMVMAVGCAPLQVERRVERGPVLRTYAQERVLGEKALAAEVEAHWPRLTFRFLSSEVCRTEQHEEFIENVITERHEPSAAPAFSAGLVNTVLGGALLLARPLFSNAPDRDAIDREGRYGASSRKKATVWGSVFVVLGVPSLVTGIVQSLRSGEETETRKGDAVVSLREAPCRVEPANGQVEFAGGAGAPPAPRATTDGALTLTVEEMRGMRFEGVLLDGVPAVLTSEAQERVSNFRVCARLLTEPMAAAVLAQAGVGQLRAVRQQVAGCEAIPEAPTAERLRMLDEALSAQASRVETPDSPQVGSFEEALAVYRPSLNITPDSAALQKLEDPEALTGQALTLRGVLERYEGQNIAVVQVGPARVLVFLAQDRLWGAELRRGSRVELVGVAMGRQRLGDLELPLVRAVWMRTAL